MQAAHYSSLLPDILRHKSSKVRLFQPQVILLDFHGTISERRWEDKIIYPYVKRTVAQFIKDNLTNESIQKCIPALRNESFEQRFRNKYEDAPVIEEQSEIDESNLDQQAQQISDFLIWQMNTRRETRETQIVERLAWQDGIKRKLIATPLYDDVMPCIKEWHDHLNKSIYVISSIDGPTLKLLFENTDKGNLNQYLSGFISSKKIGDKLMADTYKQFYDGLLAKTIIVESSSFKISTHSKHGKQKANKSQPQTDNGQHLQRASSPSVSSSSSIGSGSTQSSEFVSKPILFITDSGQEAKAASQVSDGSIFECVLINRPGNKRIRSYYLTQFQYIDKLDDIEFVQ